MTQLDDAVANAQAILKAAEGVVFAYRAMNDESRAKLLTFHPTLNTQCQMLANAYKRTFGA